MEENIWQDQAQRQEAVWSHWISCKLCMSYTKVALNMALPKESSGKQHWEVPTLAAVGFNFYLAVPLPCRNTVLHLQVGQALKNIYLGYFRALWNNVELCTYITMFWLGCEWDKFWKDFFFSGRWKEISCTAELKAFVVDITYRVLQSGLFWRSRKMTAFFF